MCVVHRKIIDELTSREQLSPHKRTGVERSITLGRLPAVFATSGAPTSHFGSPRITMTHDNAPHRIFKISELARLIASQLVSTDRRTIVNLACACKYLEEPVLSTLWETQSSLCTLLRVLPEETWEYAYPALSKCVVRSLDFLLEKLNT